MSDFDVTEIRKDFPILKQQINEKPLVYLDNAATTQKPQAVIDAITHYYENDNSNVHRGVHSLSERATQAYEDARSKVQHFINAKSRKEIIFTRGTTEAINLVAHSFMWHRIRPGEEIIVTEMEHHSNIVPWQMLCKERGCNLRVIPINDDGELILEEFEKLINKDVKLLALGHISNALGTVNPIKQLIEIAHANDILVLIDGAQAAPHTSIDVQDLDCDFYTISGHKMYGPTGIGVLYGREDLLESSPPYQGGGEMIRQVSFESVEWNSLPHKFEAGTPNIAGAIGLGAAIDYLNRHHLDKIAAYEKELLDYATDLLHQVKGFIPVGTAKDKASIISFNLDRVHAHDIGTVLNSLGIAVRAGHHCAMPVMAHFDIAAAARASFAFYNTKEEIDKLVSALAQVQEVLS